EAARNHYRRAANAPSTTYFQINSMLEQVLLFESLGFRPDATVPVRAELELRRGVLEQRLGGLKKSASRFTKVVVCSGHMIDKPGRSEERFPARKEAVVGDAIEAQLERWQIGASDLAICGGARGADMLFAERCLARRAEVWLFLPLEEGAFLDESVRLPDGHGNWEDRYYTLSDAGQVTVVSQPDRLKAPPKGVSPFARNNLWILNTARVEADDARKLHAVLVWDEKTTGDGPGGTSDFAARVKRLGGRQAIINPTKL